MDKKTTGNRGMNTNTNNSDQGQLISNQPQNGELFDRVAFILDQARASVVRSVNNQMVIAYWLIGREIVKEAQGGDERAEYGKKVLEELSARLSQRYGRGFSMTNLRFGELTHQDVGQMDSYVRIFDDRYITPGDNPTIGLILCSKKNETIAKYSVLNNSKQLFASKYMLYLPTEEELKREIQHQRQLIEEGSKHDK